MLIKITHCTNIMHSQQNIWRKILLGPFCSIDHFTFNQCNIMSVCICTKEDEKNCNCKSHRLPKQRKCIFMSSRRFRIQVIYCAYYSPQIHDGKSRNDVATMLIGWQSHKVNCDISDKPDHAADCSEIA